MTDDRLISLMDPKSHNENSYVPYLTLDSYISYLSNLNLSKSMA